VSIIQPGEIFQCKFNPYEKSSTNVHFSVGNNSGRRDFSGQNIQSGIIFQSKNVQTVGKMKQIRYSSLGKLQTGEIFQAKISSQERGFSRKMSRQ
jgi:hypothetical protein